MSLTCVHAATAMYSPWRHASECVQFAKFEHLSGTKEFKMQGGYEFPLCMAYLETLLKPSSSLLCYLDYGEPLKAFTSPLAPQPLPLGEADVDAAVHLNTLHAHWVYVEQFWRVYGRGVVDVDAPQSGAWVGAQATRPPRSFTAHPKCPLEPMAHAVQ